MKRYLRAFNGLVEIRTSIAIFTSTVAGTLFGYFHSGHFNLRLFSVFLICTVLLDMVSTAFNTIYDYYKAIDTSGYLYNVHNPIVAFHLNPKLAILIGLGLLGIASLLGLYLTYETSPYLLLIGGVSAFIALIYSAGEIPIAYFPISEAVSGFFEGTVVFMVASFLQTGSFTWSALIGSLPILLSISNIMLANNITDMAEDRKNNRHTLPLVLGRRGALFLLFTTTTLSIIGSVLIALLGIYPLTTFLLLLFIPIIGLNLRFFVRQPTKAVGFAKVLQNSLLVNIGIIIAFLLNSTVFTTYFH